MGGNAQLFRWSERLLIVAMFACLTTAVVMLVNGKDDLATAFGRFTFGIGMLIFALRLIKRQSRQSPNTH